jgi:YVTN family beta-propeller protein
MLTVCAFAGLAIGQTGFTNFETGPVHPVDMTPDGTRLLVTNTADARVEVFTLGGAIPVWSGSIPVGLDPVSVRVRSNTEAWVVNRISDSVSVVDLGTMNVVATIATGDEPGDVVFAGSPQRAWVSVSGLNQVRVYDPANIAAAPTIISIAGHRPTAMLTDGTRVMAAIFFAGNRSTALSADVVSRADGPAGGANPPSNTSTSAFNPPLAPGLPIPPAVGMIVNRETTPNGDRWKDDAGRFWDAKVGWLLSANAVAVINASTQAVAYAKNIGNIQMGLGLNPANGKVYVTQVYLRNESRFESVARSQFPRTRVALFDPATLSGGGIVDLNPHLMVTPPIATYKSSITAAERSMSIADPRGIVWKSDGSAAYVSGMGSNNVAKLTFPGSAPTRLATIPVGQGPTGMAYDAARNRLYVYNRFDANVSVINTSSDVEIGRVGFFDPTPAAIKAGRPVHYSAMSSFYGIAACNSCHIDTKTDMQAWDLGDPSASMKTFNQTCDVPGACNDWHPMKGPMMTQTLQGIVGNGPMHRRGDREDVAAFTVGFTGLLGMAAPPNAGQMQQLTDFYATLAFPPQPNRTMSDGLPGSVPGFAGSPSAGAALFNGPAINGAAKSCVQCHSLDSGGGIEIVSGATIGQSQGLKAPHLRDLYRQSGFDKSSQSSNRGYGFGHDGSSGTLFEFLQGHTVTFPATNAGDQMRRDLEAYLMCFSTGMHPAVGTQQTITAANKNDPTVLAWIGTMQAIADSGAVGLVAHGKAAGLARGYVYVAGSGAMQSDRLTEMPMLAALVSGVAAGNEVTLTVVPAGTQIRAGVDRDADGFFDRDEIDAGSSPSDPLSMPPSSCRPTIGQSPQPVTVFAGHTVHFTVSANAAVSYQWRKGGTVLSDSATVSGAHTPALTLSPVMVGDSGLYDCVVTNGCGATVSGASALTVNPCAADFNGGGLAVQDIFDFLNAWFAGLPSADFNGGGLAVQDIFDFLNAWFAGC